MKFGGILVIAATLVAAPFAAVAGELESRVSIDFAVDTGQWFDGRRSVGGTLVIRNNGDQPLTAVHPENRMALAFLLLDSLGRAVPDAGRWKVKAFAREITIPARSEYKHTFERLAFITGSSLSEYTLNSGEMYRLIVVYRPNGENDTGVASPERRFTAP